MSTRDMTQGSTTKHLMACAVPLILGNLFQVTYHAVDSIVIGHFSGNASLAAVSTAEPVMNMLILGVSGVCIGASVLMGNFYGARDYAKLRRELGTSVSLGLAFSGIVFLVSLIAVGIILRLMQVKPELMREASIYLRIVLMGMPFTCLYNVYAAALRSAGDYVTPVLFLAASSVLNGVLDVLFVSGASMGAFGVAIATVIAQSVSAIACIMYVNRKVPLLRLSRADLKPDAILLRQTLNYGLTTALQQSSQPIGKLFIQGVVNTLSIEVIAAFNIVGKIEDFTLLPERTLSTAMMTFIAQNDGAGQRGRVRRCIWIGMSMEFGYFLCMCVAVLLFHKPVLSLFSPSEVVLREGSLYFSIMAYAYCLAAFTNGSQGILRGLKRMKLSLAGTITQISFRVLFSFLLIPRMGIIGIAWSCVIGWAAMLVLVGVRLKLRPL